jgi:RNA polymerase sigma factor (sigma-70 family)
MSPSIVMDPTEHQLLEAYIRDQSEEAFCKLVERHLDMVYHTALRRIGNSALAEDVSQQVFTILARKALGLKAGSGLGRWLHRTTLYESSKTLRAECRRAAKMKELAQHQATRADDRAWDTVLPLLDEAIENLPKNDRKAIILRFFEELSLKLGLVLKRRGFAASIAGLSSMLAAESAKAASINRAWSAGRDFEHHYLNPS